MSHSKHVAPSISAKRWQYLKGLGLRPGRMIHQSAAVAMIPHPDPLTPPKPWIQKPGVTFDVNRNKLKEMRRALCGVRK